MAQQGGLGRGLASLIPQRKKGASKEANYFGSTSGSNKSLEVKKNESGEIKYPEENGVSIISPDKSADTDISNIPTGSVLPNPYQPRKYFDEEKLQELADSIKEHGILQPLIVNKNGDNEYELIAGERRLEASKIVGLEKVPVVIKKVDNEKKLEIALIENIQRHNLNAIEEAMAYKKLQDEFGLTQEEVAKKVGKSRSAVANTLRLLNLPIEIQRSLISGKITEGHARMILTVANPEKQRALFELILKDKLNVRQVERKVKEVSISSHKRKIRIPDPEMEDRENQLGSLLGTKVKIKKNRNGGQIVIDYYSGEEFNGIFNKLTNK
jgi:ParB family transcriptional regulator, chromosome partitioning protein